MSAWLYRWLPIIFGCHCRSDRSFFWKGRQFPICARCTGELVGILFSPLILVLCGVPDWKLCVILALPLVVDGFAQKLTRYESGNLRRLVTGILFGCALVGWIVFSSLQAAQMGFIIGKNLK